MRTSSMKSRIAAVTTLVITLTLAVPCADAKPVRQNKGRGVFATITQLIHRYFGIATNGGYPGDPIPVEATFFVPDDPTAPKETTVRR
jgi:hypothetical protein